MCSGAAMIDAKEAQARLKARYSPPEWFYQPECTMYFGQEGQRRADGIAFNLYPSRGNTVEIFEIKVTRQDFLNELRNPSKAEPFFRQADKFWLVLGDVSIWHEGEDEVPPDWGILRPWGRASLRVARKATNREGSPQRDFFARLIDRAAHCSDFQEAVHAARREGYKNGAEAERRNAETKSERDAFAEDIGELLGPLGISLSFRASAEKRIKDLAELDNALGLHYRLGRSLERTANELERLAKDARRRVALMRQEEPAA